LLYDLEIGLPVPDITLQLEAELEVLAQRLKVRGGSATGEWLEQEEHLREACRLYGTIDAELRDAGMDLQNLVPHRVYINAAFSEKEVVGACLTGIRLPP
jgi:deoxyadenosine/deoxycytidine kinase